MRLLLDTHILLWAARNDRRLSPRAEAMISDPANALHFSVASIWEVAIKTSRTRPDFEVDPRRLRRTLLEVGYSELAVTGEQAERVALLPAIHKDPFDRLLMAQAWVEDLLLLTADAALASYPGPIQRV